MAKYSEQSVLALKLETERLSQEISEQIERKKTAIADAIAEEDKIFKLRALYNSTRDKLEKMIVNLSLEREQLVKSNNQLTESIENLKREEQQMGIVISVLRSGIKNIKSPSADLSFAKQVAKKLAKDVGDLNAARLVAAAVCEELKVTNASLEESAKQLRSQILESEKRLKDIEEQIVVRGEKNARLGNAMLKLEHKIRVMQSR